MIIFCKSVIRGINHDKVENIKDYINRFTPNDIKSSRKVAPEFLQYINSPVIFNISFLIDRETKLLKDYADENNMESFLLAFKDFVKQIDSNSAFYEGFVESVLKRASAFQKDFGGKNFNAKLSRQIFLVATFVSLVFYYLNKIKEPSHIAWISDRDALVDRYDGFIYDLAYFMFLAECSSTISEVDKSKKIILDKPNFVFTIPEKTGKNFYDELIRIPDYLAGTLADIDIDENEFSKDKYYTVLYHSLVNSKNHAIFHVYGDSSKLSSRRLAYRA